VATTRLGVIVRKYLLVAAVIGVCLIAMFSACTFVVARDRESLVRSAEAGGSIARLLIQGSNFWARYFVFCSIAFASLLYGWWRMLTGTGRW
jgi:hypothetical protein